jgi:hypothetical protein
MGFINYIGWAKPTDRGNALRKVVNRETWIVRSGGFAVRPCRVIDISDTGVQLSLDRRQMIPNDFVLRMSRNHPGRAVRVKWRRGSQVGAIFV